MPDNKEEVIEKKQRKHSRKSIDPKALSEALRRNLKRRKEANTNKEEK